MQNSSKKVSLGFWKIIFVYAKPSSLDLHTIRYHFTKNLLSWFSIWWVLMKIWYNRWPIRKKFHQKLFLVTLENSFWLGFKNWKLGYWLRKMRVPLFSIVTFWWWYATLFFISAASNKSSWINGPKIILMIWQPRI